MRSDILLGCALVLPLASGFSFAPSIGIRSQSTAHRTRGVGASRMVATPLDIPRSVVKIPDYTGWNDLSKPPPFSLKDISEVRTFARRTCTEISRVACCSRPSANRFWVKDGAGVVLGAVWTSPCETGALRQACETMVRNWGWVYLWAVPTDIPTPMLHSDGARRLSGESRQDRGWFG